MVINERRAWLYLQTEREEKEPGRKLQAGVFGAQGLQTFRALAPKNSLKQQEASFLAPLHEYK
jgi:hypothetical protein